VNCNIRAATLPALAVILKTHLQNGAYLLEEAAVVIVAVAIVLALLLFLSIALLLCSRGLRRRVNWLRTRVAQRGAAVPETLVQGGGP
jgi:hypothetical protein